MYGVSVYSTELLFSCFATTSRKMSTTKTEELSNLFVYGSLKDAQVFFDVTGEHCPVKEQALLKDFCFTPPVCGYPAIVYQKGSFIIGEIIHGIPPHQFEKLDIYEDAGSLYQRIQVRVLVDQQDTKAFVYIKKKDEQ